MSYIKIFTSFFVSVGLIIAPGAVFAENDPSLKYRALATENSDLSISTINSLLEQAKIAISTGNLDSATEKLKKAITSSNFLIKYYRDLHSSFKGIDALIPRELTKKNRNVVQLLAKANMQLAIIYRSKGEPDLAIPLLVEVVKTLSPSNPYGANAYQQLVELGLVDTPYGGALKQSL